MDRDENRDRMMAEGQLSQIRSQLRGLARKRAALRIATAVITFVVISVWLLAIAFVFDWFVHFSVDSRRLLLGVLAVVIGVFLQRMIVFLFSHQESVEDLALQIEKRNGIDSDLIAALEFDSRDSEYRQSTDLRQAIISDVLNRTKSLNLLQEFSLGLLPQRVLMFAVTSVAVLIFSFFSFVTIATFGNRLLLGNAQYSTRTRIEAIVVNGQTVTPAQGPELVRVHIPFGRALRIEISCSGEVPMTARVRLSARTSGLKDRIELKRSLPDGALFQGELPRIANPFRFDILAGDATSMPIEVVIDPLPMVEFQWQIEPPEYAKTAVDSTIETINSNQITLLEGSSARLKLKCSNKKLDSAQLAMGNSTYPLVPPADEHGPESTWILPEAPAFEDIRDSFTYEIQVIDCDGLSMDRPIIGSIRAKQDRSPRVGLFAVTQYVLPTAQPKLDYDVNDDFGISTIVAIIEVMHSDGRTATHELNVRSISTSDQPVFELRDQAVVPLSQYGLSKKDVVKVHLEVTDWRGKDSGKRTDSDPHLFFVTDQNEILSRMNEGDKQAVKTLDEIIKLMEKSSTISPTPIP